MSVPGSAIARHPSNVNGTEQFENPAPGTPVLTRIPDGAFGKGGCRSIKAQNITWQARKRDGWGDFSVAGRSKRHAERLPAPYHGEQ